MFSVHVVSECEVNFCKLQKGFNKKFYTNILGQKFLELQYHVYGEYTSHCLAKNWLILSEERFRKCRSSAHVHAHCITCESALSLNSTLKKYDL